MFPNWRQSALVRQLRRSPCRDQDANRKRSQPIRCEQLEDRTLLSVVYMPGPLAAPAVNRNDLMLGQFGGIPPIEPALTVNPTDPANIALSSQVGLRLTNDAVGTLSPQPMLFPAPQGTRRDGDTSTAFDADGNLFWSNLAIFLPPQAGRRDVAAVQVDPHTGRMGPAFLVPNPQGRVNDKEFLAADANLFGRSRFRNNLYVAFSQFNPTTKQFELFFSRSTPPAPRGNRVWQAPIQLSVAAEGFAWGASVSVGPQGDVYVAYHSQPELTDVEVDVDGSRRNPSGRTGQLIVVRSTDGGATFPQKTVAMQPGQADISFNAQDAANGGNIAGTQFWTLGSCQPWVLADPSRVGSIYVVAADDPDNMHGRGDDADVFIARSGDNGRTWNRTLISAGPNNSFQLFPTAAIDRFGNIAVAWYDNRLGSTNRAGRFLLDVFATYSRDGGLNWAPDFQVNGSARQANPFDPDAGARVKFKGPPPTTRIGEYFGIDLFGAPPM